MSASARPYQLKERERVPVLVGVGAVPLDGLLGVDVKVAAVARAGHLGDVRRDKRLSSASGKARLKRMQVIYLCQQLVPINRLKVLLLLDVVGAAVHVAEAQREVHLQQPANELLLVLREVAAVAAIHD